MESSTGTTRKIVPVSFSVASISETWNEALPLMRENHLECGPLAQEHFKPDRERYVLLERAGAIMAYAAREGKDLVGYCTHMVSAHLHYPALKWALQDAFFVRPHARGRVAIRFLKWMDEHLAKEGVDVVMRQSSTRKPWGPVLVRAGYAEIETGYMRRIA